MTNPIEGTKGCSLSAYRSDLAQSLSSDQAATRGRGIYLERPATRELRIFLQSPKQAKIIRALATMEHR
jgi:hypothetical protein